MAPEIDRKLIADIAGTDASQRAAVFQAAVNEVDAARDRLAQMYLSLTATELRAVNPTIATVHITVEQDGGLYVKTVGLFTADGREIKHSTDRDTENQLFQINGYLQQALVNSGSGYGSAAMSVFKPFKPDGHDPYSVIQHYRITLKDIDGIDPNEEPLPQYAAFLNANATFHPADEGTLPMLQVGGVTVIAYVKPDGKLQVSICTDNADERLPRAFAGEAPAVCVVINDDTVWIAEPDTGR